MTVGVTRKYADSSASSSARSMIVSGVAGLRLAATASISA
jgi:hypothetical protein